MPDFEETDEVPDAVVRMEDFLNEQVGRAEGLTVGDLDNMFQVIYLRLRSIFTTDQMHVRLHGMMAQGEHMLATPGFLEDEYGNPSTPILRENFPDMPDEEYGKMMNEMYAEVSDEAIASLLNEEE